jgi:hypothetical protein
LGRAAEEDRAAGGRQGPVTKLNWDKATRYPQDPGSVVEVPEITRPIVVLTQQEREKRKAKRAKRLRKLLKRSERIRQEQVAEKRKALGLPHAPPQAD